jgi:hypothetical protein
LAGTWNFTGTFQIGGVTITYPASGVLLGSTDTQTVSGKSFSCSANTCTNIPNSALVNQGLTLGSTSGINLGSTTSSIAGLTLTASPILALRDASAAFDVSLVATSSATLTGGRVVTFDVVNGSRTFKLGSNLTVATDPGAVTGALKANGTGTFTQAACGDLSNSGSGCAGTLPTGANPSATIGAAATNGSATTFLRSDSAPAIGSNAVTNALLAQAASKTLKGNLSGVTANVSDISAPDCPDTGGQHWNSSGGVIICGTSGGGSGTPIIFEGAATGTNTYTVSSLTPGSGFAYTDGYILRLRFANGNTSGATINALTLGAIPINKQTLSGLAALTGSEIQAANTQYDLVYNAAAGVFVMTTIIPGTAAFQNISTSGANVGLLSTVNTFSKKQFITPVTLTDSSSIAVDPTLSNQYYWTIGTSGNCLANPSPTLTGNDTTVFYIIQGGSGNNIPCASGWPTAYHWADGSVCTPGVTYPCWSTAVGAEDRIVCNVPLGQTYWDCSHPQISFALPAWSLYANHAISTVAGSGGSTTVTVAIANTVAGAFRTVEFGFCGNSGCTGATASPTSVTDGTTACTHESGTLVSVAAYATDIWKCSNVQNAGTITGTWASPVFYGVAAAQEWKNAAATVSAGLGNINSGNPVTSLSVSSSGSVSQIGALVLSAILNSGTAGQTSGQTSIDQSAGNGIELGIAYQLPSSTGTKTNSATFGSSYGVGSIAVFNHQ